MENLLMKKGGKWEQVGPNKRVGLGKKSKNANQVDSFIWHLRVAPKASHAQRAKKMATGGVHICES